MFTIKTTKKYYRNQQFGIHVNKFFGIKIAPI